MELSCLTPSTHYVVYCRSVNTHILFALCWQQFDFLSVACVEQKGRKLPYYMSYSVKWRLPRLLIVVYAHMVKSSFYDDFLIFGGHDRLLLPDISQEMLNNSNNASGQTSPSMIWKKISKKLPIFRYMSIQRLWLSLQLQWFAMSIRNLILLNRSALIAPRCITGSATRKRFSWSTCLILRGDHRSYRIHLLLWIFAATAPNGC